MQLDHIFFLIIAGIIFYGVKLYRIAKKAEHKAQQQYENEVLGKRHPGRDIVYTPEGRAKNIPVPMTIPPTPPPLAASYPPVVGHAAAAEVQQRTLHAQERELVRQGQMNERLAELRAQRIANVAKIEDISVSSVARAHRQTNLSKPALPVTTFRQQLKNPASFRRAILFHEILSPPVSLR